MKLIRGTYHLCQFPALKHGCVLTIGNFDGVHLGHKQILQRLLEKSQALGLPSVVMIFEPQPREFFAEHFSHLTAPVRLMRLRDKINALTEVGVDYVLCLRFNQHFASQAPQVFIEKLLVEKLKVKYLSVGDDFRFGAKRAGNFDTLKQAGAECGFEVEDSHSHCFDKIRISSSLIREALQQDNLALAEKLLGQPYSLRGRVAHGNKLGRTIGFPTANIMLNRCKMAVQGVYAVEVETMEGRFNGIANVGNRPTINGVKPLLEVHLFDFHQQLYGQEIKVSFLHKIRNEIKFSHVNALKRQIEQDVMAAKAFFLTST